MCVSPLLPPTRVHQAWTRRREKLRTRPRRPRTHRRATRRRRRRRTRPPRRRRRRRRRPRPRPRRPRRRPASGSAHVDQRPQILVFIGAARSPGMKPPRHSRIFACRRTRGGPTRPPRASGLRETRNRQDSITQAWTPEELAYAARVSDCVETTSASGAPDNSSLSHFSAMTRPSWLGPAVRNRHRHAIEQASRRWRGGRRGDSVRTHRKILISTQVSDLYGRGVLPNCPVPTQCINF